MLEPRCLEPSSKVFLELVDSFWLAYPLLEMRSPDKEVLASASSFLQVDPQPALRTNSGLILMVKVLNPARWAQNTRYCCLGSTGTLWSCASSLLPKIWAQGTAGMCLVSHPQSCSLAGEGKAGGREMFLQLPQGWAHHQLPEVTGT